VNLHSSKCIFALLEFFQHFGIFDFTKYNLFSFFLLRANTLRIFLSQFWVEPEANARTFRFYLTVGIFGKKGEPSGPDQGPAGPTGRPA
jgi:hypothetical protein